jgi:hypothetical protein
MEIAYLENQTNTGKGIDSLSYAVLSGVATLQEVDDFLAHLPVSPNTLYIATLDDFGQCCYTSMHAGMGDLLYVDEPDIDSEDDPAQDLARDIEKAQHVAAQLDNPELQVSWADMASVLITFPEDIKALLAVNQNPALVLDDEVCIQRVPLVATRPDLAIAGLPNGYFSCDWNTFQNHCVIRRMIERYDYRFIGLGASWLGFVRSKPLSAMEADSLLADIRHLYGTHEEVMQLWLDLREVFMQQTTLMLAYGEAFSERFG